MRMTDNEPGVIYAKMLGGFSVTFNGRILAGGSRASDSQTDHLLMMLLHHAGESVGRSELEEFVFADRELSNIHHALQSVIYNTKKKLARLGLPDASDCIRQEKDRFFWDSSVPLVEDSLEFTRLYDAAYESEDAGERLSLLMEAVHWYTGEFLPSQTSVVWAAREARDLKEKFCRVVEDAAELLRQTQDFFQMEELGLYASKTDPLSDWECVTMDALVSLGRYEEARELYEDTVEYYLNEQGLRPSKNLMDKFSRLAGKMQHRHAVLDEIQQALTGLNETVPGGYLCSYPVFTGIYRMMERMMERGGQSVYLMLCTVVDSKGVPMERSDMLEELSHRMLDAVRASIRHGDAMCRYGNGQCLVLLINTTLEDCGIIQKRINSRFLIGRQRTGIQYYVNSLFWTPEQAAEVMPQGGSV